MRKLLLLVICGLALTAGTAGATATTTFTGSTNPSRQFVANFTTLRTGDITVMIHTDKTGPYNWEVDSWGPTGSGPFATLCYGQQQIGPTYSCAAASQPAGIYHITVWGGKTTTAQFTVTAETGP